MTLSLRHVPAWIRWAMETHDDNLRYHRWGQSWHHGFQWSAYQSLHYGDVIISATVYQITGVSIGCSTVCSGGAESIKAPRHWPLWGESTGGFPSQRTSNAKCFHLITSSWRATHETLPSRWLHKLIHGNRAIVADIGWLMCPSNNPRNLGINAGLNYLHLDIACLQQNASSMQILWGVLYMMTSSKGKIFHVTDHLCGGFIDHRWITHTKAGDAELWCFLWSAPE